MFLPPKTNNPSSEKSVYWAPPTVESAPAQAEAGSLWRQSLENEEMQISHCLVRKKITKTPTAGCFGPPRNSILLILWTRYKPRALEQQKHTLPEAPENGWLEYSFPFRMAYFQVRTDSFEGRLDQNFQLTWSKLLVSRSLKAPETNYTHLNQLQLPPSFLDAVRAPLFKRMKLWRSSSDLILFTSQ